MFVSLVYRCVARRHTAENTVMIWRKHLKQHMPLLHISKGRGQVISQGFRRGGRGVCAAFKVMPAAPASQQDYLAAAAAAWRLGAQGSGFSSPRRAAISAEARSMPARSLAACAAAASLAVSVSACDHGCVSVAQQAIQKALGPGCLQASAHTSGRRSKFRQHPMTHTHRRVSAQRWQRQRQGQQQQLLIDCVTARCSAPADDACYGVGKPPASCCAICCRASAPRAARALTAAFSSATLQQHHPH